MTTISHSELLPDYDYIFAGAGCAALSLLHRMIGEGLVDGKRVLLIDRDAKRDNDRTWCFWEQGAGPFEPIVYRRWEQLGVYGAGLSRELSIAPYQYKLIRGIDFYEHCRAATDAHPGIHFLQAAVASVRTEGDRGVVEAGGCTVQAPYIFNSIYTRPEKGERLQWLLQHFKGRVIETAVPCFDPAHATLMDFRVPQDAGTTFVYVLPFSERRALVEYTLFTGSLLEPAAYDRALDDYIANRLGISDYKIEDEEFGIIPMTNYRFPEGAGRVLNLGTAGGQTKGSSGYTFRNIQKHSAQMAERLKTTGQPFGAETVAGRYRFYDNVLLDILHRRSLEGSDIFVELFRRNDPRKVLRFLDNETSLSEEIRIISGLPIFPFSRAAVRVLTGK